MKIGILALQGSYEEHAKAITELGKEVVFVRYPEQLGEISGLIIPGGESTTMERLMRQMGLDEALREGFFILITLRVAKGCGLFESLRRLEGRRPARGSS